MNSLIKENKALKKEERMLERKIGDATIWQSLTAIDYPKKHPNAESSFTDIAEFYIYVQESQLRTPIYNVAMHYCHKLFFIRFSGVSVGTNNDGRFISLPSPQRCNFTPFTDYLSFISSTYDTTPETLIKTFSIFLYHGILNRRGSVHLKVGAGNLLHPYLTLNEVTEQKMLANEETRELLLKIKGMCASAIPISELKDFAKDLKFLDDKIQEKRKSEE